jgi:segregation and condensation protein A
VETNYTVKTSGYEGPFELLLELIEKRKLFVNDIAIATVTDDFLSYIKASENRSPSYISAFIVVAATLLLIKSRSLLPNFNLTQEEKEEVGALERRLTMYKIISDVGEKNKKTIWSAPVIFL